MTLAKFLTFLGTGLTLGGFAPCSATTLLDFTGSNYGPAAGSVTSTTNGISVTASAYWVNANNSGATVTGANNDFASAWIGEYSGAGLGVCNPNEQPSCAAPQHQIDNLNGLDFVNFSFNQNVSLNSVYVVGYGNPTGSGYNDVDLSYALLTGAQEASLLSGTLSLSSVNFTTYNTNFYGYNSYTLSGTGQYLLVGAAVTPYYGDASNQATPDAFKIQNLTVTGMSSATPEPVSVALAGSGLILLAFFRRRATQLQS